MLDCCAEIVLRTEVHSLFPEQTLCSGWRQCLSLPGPISDVLAQNQYLIPLQTNRISVPCEPFPICLRADLPKPKPSLASRGSVLCHVCQSERIQKLSGSHTEDLQRRCSVETLSSLHSGETLHPENAQIRPQFHALTIPLLHTSTEESWGGEILL